MYQIEDLVAREIQNDCRRYAQQARLARQAASFQPLQLIRRALARIERLFGKIERHSRPLTAHPVTSERMHRI